MMEADELRALAEVVRQGAARRRIADLEATIARQKIASSHLSAQGLPTQEVERIIDILAWSLQFVRSYQAAMDHDSRLADEARAPAKAIS
jgi:hypothetical protein